MKNIFVVIDRRSVVASVQRRQLVRLSHPGSHVIRVNVPEASEESGLTCAPYDKKINVVDALLTSHAAFAQVQSDKLQSET